jgi:hypothetical protein
MSCIRICERRRRYTAVLAPAKSIRSSSIFLFNGLSSKPNGTALKGWIHEDFASAGIPVGLFGMDVEYLYRDNSGVNQMPPDRSSI